MECFGGTAARTEDLNLSFGVFFLLKIGTCADDFAGHENTYAERKTKLWTFQKSLSAKFAARTPPISGEQ